MKNLIVLNNGIIAFPSRIGAIKKIILEDIHCYRLEIHFDFDVICFDYLDLDTLVRDYTEILNYLKGE